MSDLYILDTSYSNVIGFVIRHAMITKVQGSFTDFEASFDLDTHTAQATIKVDSLDTKNRKRDAHVKSADFFDVENFPTITFTATNANMQGNSGTITGDLTIKGHTQPVTLDVKLTGFFEDLWDQTTIHVEATTTINRKDFGIDFNVPLNTGDMLISNDIKIVIDGCAIQQ
ncbi:MAG: YceI family protein [Corynebacterium sp.]|nr:YceI family protein [Corynebacterium sp.]